MRFDCFVFVKYYDKISTYVYRLKVFHSKQQRVMFLPQNIFIFNLSIILTVSLTRISLQYLSRICSNILTSFVFIKTLHSTPLPGEWQRLRCLRPYGWEGRACHSRSRPPQWPQSRHLHRCRPKDLHSLHQKTKP